MQDFLWNIDLSIFKFFNQSLSYPWLDQITPIITNLDLFTWFRIGFPLLIFLFFFKKFGRIGITYFLFCLLAFAASDFTGAIIKKMVLRPRPFQVEETHAIKKSEAKQDRSFYSNHSSNSFTVASYLSTFFPAGQIAMFICASLIALTRLHVGVHYPSDVLFGSLMGTMWGLLISRFVQFVIRKTHPKTDIKLTSKIQSTLKK